MTDAPVSIPRSTRQPRFPAWSIALALAIVLATVWLASAWRPDFALIADAGPVIQIHLATAVAALAIGAILLAGRKGRTLHRTLGWVWVTCMMTTAIATLFIRDLNPPSMSWIHGFSFYVLAAAPLGIWFARRHKVKAHRGIMTGMFIGGLIIAGAFAFLPGRLMYQVFFG